MTATDQDERRGQPSASSFARYEACPGSFQLEQEARRLNQLAHQTDPLAERGTRIHKYLADPESIELAEPELRVAHDLRDRADEQVRRIFGDAPYHELKEKRVWLKP